MEVRCERRAGKVNKKNRRFGKQFRVGGGAGGTETTVDTRRRKNQGGTCGFTQPLTQEVNEFYRRLDSPTFQECHSSAENHPV